MQPTISKKLSKLLPVNPFLIFAGLAMKTQNFHRIFEQFRYKEIAPAGDVKDIKPAGQRRMELSKPHGP